MKSLLMILSGGPQSADALKSAVILEKALEARLVVAHPTPPMPAAAVMAGDMGVALGAIEFAQDDYSVENARAAFEAVCGNDPACRFRETQTTPYETLRKFSLFADLVVLARDRGLADTGVVQLKEALVTNQMPTMWLPPEPLTAAPRTVVCVWNGQGPSARAIKAAYPFLTRAERVIIVEYAGNEVNHSRLESYLDAYDLKVSAWRPYGDAGLSARGRARALMAEAKSAGADLLVMGAYGEMVESFFSFGRATEKVAEAATVPVLFHN
jgi:nucleotide-binding universal stress UspA family protein